MYQHTTDEVIMIRPYSFYSNEQTAVNNVYQHSNEENKISIQEKAVREFENLKQALIDKGVTVHMLFDTAEPSTPDSIFPNNWFSTHEGEKMVLYPMFASNRQIEMHKFKHQVEEIVAKRQASDKLLSIVDYSPYYENRKYLEGTGAVVIDRKSKTAYCCLSPRADLELFQQFCKELGYEGITFRAFQEGRPIYHTNVLMGIGENKAIVCLEAIKDKQERQMVYDKLINSGKEVIEISLEQVKQFLGNTLELKGRDRENFIVMSETAYRSLSPSQKKVILKDTEIVHVPVDTIEYYGGGSVRCMIAEVF